MTSEGIAEARALLDRIEAGIAAGDLAALDAMCAEDVVLFGTAQASFGPEATGDYLRRVVAAGTVRWLLDDWAVLHHDDSTLLAAAAGLLVTDVGEGEERAAFRLTLWLVRRDGEWRLGHFHGSLPDL